jgi:fructose-bisphosphate aldolase, class I
MDKAILTTTVGNLTAPPKGILAIDESTPTCQKRFEKLGIPFTEEKRREYRDLLVTAPGIEKYVSGYILFDETIRQSTLNGESFVSVLQNKGVEPGIKLDQGPVDLPGHPLEKITSGDEGLEARVSEYRKLGATFGKWRAIYTISPTTPTETAMKENAALFVKYARACQKENIVPIVEPEVLLDGHHSIEKCYEVTSNNLDIVFNELKSAGIYLPGIILKTSMVLPGKDSAKQSSNEEIARMTVKCLKEHVPPDIGGIVFLSGGQEDEEATLRLNAMHELGALPWPLTFSYGRAIQNEALKSWAKNPADVAAAQKFLLEAARRNSLASVGKYK